LLNLPIELDHTAITQAIFRGRKPDPNWLEKVRAVVRSVEPVLQPKAIFRWFSVEKVEDDSVVFIDSDTHESFMLQMGEHSDELAGAQEMLCCVATLGEKIDQILQQWTRTGEVLDGYLADCVGIYGLLQVSRAVYQKVERIAADKGWGVGRVLCPGAIEGWQLEQQQNVCALLPMEQIGVVLNDYGVLSPARSVSFLIGIGSGYASTSVDSPCDICTNGGECWCKC